MPIEPVAFRDLEFRRTFAWASAQTFHLDGIDASEMQRIDQALSITAGINKSLGASDVAH